MLRKGRLAPQANPQDLHAVANRPYRHPAQLGCLACHAGHGLQPVRHEPNQGPKPSTKKIGQYEHELCGHCHRNNLVYQTPASFHPVLASSIGERAPSLGEAFGERSWINCSDCHGSADAEIPPGIHGSRVPAILKADYQTQDGFEETEQTYAHCYGCHRRDSILADESFPLHRLHIVEAKASCFTCHDSHASRTLPHLLAIEDDSRSGRIQPDQFSRKTYWDNGDRAGVCYLTCHNVEHDGWAYGPEGAKRSLRKGTPQSMPGARKAPAVQRPPK
jgi:hypothetical protein